MVVAHYLLPPPIDYTVDKNLRFLSGICSFLQLNAIVSNSAHFPRKSFYGLGQDYIAHHERQLLEERIFFTIRETHLRQTNKVSSSVIFLVLV